MSDSASELQSGLSPSTITTEMFLTTDNAEWEAITESRRECAKSLVENAKHMHPNPMCACSVGQMPTSSGRCEAEISTFGVYVDEICEGIKTNADDRPYLVMQKLSETLPYAMCVRKDSDPLVINALCNDQCTIDSFVEKYRESGDPEVPLKLIG
uniref:DUF19 domain-containing protein n=1 Tax=Ascaris lumbricoides TaxID=6252 RepID=A0A0M3HSD9_ASCLU